MNNKIYDIYKLYIKLIKTKNITKCGLKSKLGCLNFKKYLELREVKK